MADTKVDQGQIQNILIIWNRLFTYVYFDHKISSPGRVGHEIYNIYEIADPEHLCFNTKRTDLFDVVTKI